ncbi:hypothetical protein PUN28_004876 [Cardiocondyla obscurior]|uniref:Uncharacterized protein n=1 Tax=Cardiocondyla obscurior TaxID=286306 RepID=A0AAW2GFZ3_9HYME
MRSRFNPQRRSKEGAIVTDGGLSSVAVFRGWSRTTGHAANPVALRYRAHPFARIRGKTYLEECKSSISQNLLADKRECEHVRLLNVPFRFHRSRPQNDLGAVERTRTVASGEATEKESPERAWVSSAH